MRTRDMGGSSSISNEWRAQKGVMQEKLEIQEEETAWSDTRFISIQRKSNWRSKTLDRHPSE